MKFKLPEQLAKTLTGIGLILVGSAVSLIPAIGQVAGPAIIAAGSGMIIYGVNDKYKRYRKGEDPLANEKAILNKLKGNSL